MPRDKAFGSLYLHTEQLDVSIESLAPEGRPRCVKKFKKSLMNDCEQTTRRLPISFMGCFKILATSFPSRLFLDAEVLLVGPTGVVLIVK